MNDINPSSYVAITSKHVLVANYVIQSLKHKSEPTLSDVIPSLKQELLLFDKVGIVGLSQFMEDTSIPIDKIRDELSWLINEGLIFEAGLYIPKKGSEEESSLNEFLKQLGSNIEIRNEIEDYYNRNNVAIKPMEEFGYKTGKNIYDLESDRKLSLEKYNKARLSGNQEASAKYLGQYADYLLKKKNRQTELRNKLLNNFLEEQKLLVLSLDSMYIQLLALTWLFYYDVFPLSLIPYRNYKVDLPHSKKSKVMKVAMNNFPLPDNSTPWEQVVDFRSDSNNQENLVSFRRWIRKLSSENLNSQEIQEELEYLINEHNNHMTMSKIKSNFGTVEALIKLPFELLENALKLKFSKLPEPLFTLSKRHISLIEAEINSPGRELAYLIKARKLFE
jgi:hypothetical protein